MNWPDDGQPPARPHRLRYRDRWPRSAGFTAPAARAAVRPPAGVRRAGLPARPHTILLGLPLYNFGAPSSVKSWVDHLIAPGLSHDPQTRAPLLGGRELVVLASRGGGYAEGTPRHGWDHAQPWLPHAISLTGLEPRFITAELTLARTSPAMAELIPLADQSLADAEHAIDALWAPVPALA